MSGQGLQKNTSSYVQARNNGFGAPGGRPRTKTEDLTDLIDDMAIEHGQDLTAMALQAVKDGMRSKDLKQRLDAAKVWLNNFHNPTKQVDMNVTENAAITPQAREAVDGLTEDERRIMAEVHSRLMAMREEAEVVDVDEVTPIQAEVVRDPEPDPAPEPSGAGWEAPVLPPLPPEGRPE